ncbi:MAG: hypothetical protein ACI85X_000979 [Woeseiaceae bacterium]|jgi:hypothetical protein|tara:strand:+ start:241 stop:342 length:102 start_codon:yes stop_codon:yes gene_type:complete
MIEKIETIILNSLVEINDELEGNLIKAIPFPSI